MPQEDVVFRFTGDTSDLKAKIQGVIDEFNRLASQFAKFGQEGLSGRTKSLADSLVGRRDQLVGELDKLDKRLAAIRDKQAEIAKGPPGTRRSLQTTEIEGQEYRAITPTQFRDPVQVEDAVNQIMERRGKIAQEIEEIEKRSGQQQVDLQQTALSLAARNRQLSSEPVQGLTQAIRERLARARQLTEELVRQKALLREQIVQQLPEKQARIIEGGDSQSREILRLEKEREQIQAQLASNDARLAAERNKAIKNESAINAIYKEREELQNKLALNQMADETARTRLRTPEGKLQQATELARATGFGQQIERQLELLKDIQRSPESLVGPEIEQFLGIADQIQGLQGGLKNLTEGSDEWKQQVDQINGLYTQQEEILGNIARKGLPEIQSIEQLREQQLAQMPGLERTLIGAFQDMTRRFQATLQFAISGALIFGAQQFLREFVQTAIEVERAFEDIKTALEFDLEAPRGSGAFNNQVNAIRLDVLALANEFNVLPSEANKAAYVMVSRFGDVENALKATRAQLLATKVSTIDQAEVLRALTAIAEGFAAAVVETETALSLQERLLRREQVSAELYGKALDYAVYIQQKFGIETEDTLEGTARANEAFRQLGFTMEETGAIVAAVSRQLGQTGVNVAERLVRSIGQINAPQIRDELLDLAAASQALVLAPSDFNTGRDAWNAIVRQIQRVQELEPATAQRVLQIIGQRREIEAVAAALGSQDLQREILLGADKAAGAAERRYSFLSETVSEQIQSIIAQFQTLAQNLEQLGILNPLKLFLEALDLSLELINKLTEAVGKLFEFVNNIPILGDLGAADALKTVLALNLALLSLGRLAIGIQGAFGFLTAGKEAFFSFAARGADALSIPGLAVVGAELGSFGEFLAAARRNGQGFIAALVAFNKALIAATIQIGINTANWAADTVGRAAARSYESLALPGAAAVGNTRALGYTILKFAGAAAGLTYAFFKLRDASAFVEDSMKRLADSITEARAQAAREAREQRLSPEEEQRRFAELALGATQREQIAFEDQGLLDRTAGAILRIGELIIGAGRPFGEDPRDVFGEERVYQEDVEQRLRALIQLIIEGMIAQIGEAEAVLGEQIKQGDLAFGIGQALGRGIPRELEDGGITYVDLEEATQGELESFLQTLLGWEGQIDAWATEVGATVDSATTTVERLRNQISEVQAKREFGNITSGAAQFLYQSIIGRAEELIKQWGDSEAPEAEDAIREAQQIIRDASQAYFDEFTDALDPQRLDFIADPVLRTKAALEDAEKTLEKAKTTFGAFSGAVRDAEYAVRSATAAYREARFQSDVSVAEIRLGQARGAQEQINAQQNLVNILQDSSFDLTGDARTQALIRYYREQEALARQIFENNKNIARARVRLSGPILNEITRINAEIAAAKKDIEFYGKTSTEALLAQIQIAELVAQRAQQQARDAAAMRLSAVSMRDSLGRLNVELTNAAAEMKLIGDLFGKNSEAFGQAKDAVEQAKIAIADALLELDTLKRILALDDPSNSYERAIIERRAIEERLQDPNLGALEKARIQVELIDAKLAEEQAFYQDRLGILAFQYESEAISKGQYIDALTQLRDQTDTSTEQGRKLWREINSLIEGLTDDMGDMAFNIPDQIRLPTLFEVRRSVEADQMGVNYMDSRTQYVVINVDQITDATELAAAIGTALGDNIEKQYLRYSPGAAGITIGGFS